MANPYNVALQLDDHQHADRVVRFRACHPVRRRRAVPQARQKRKTPRSRRFTRNVQAGRLNPAGLRLPYGADSQAAAGEFLGGIDWPTDASGMRRQLSPAADIASDRAVVPKCQFQT
jgi:hypothetical protein